MSTPTEFLPGGYPVTPQHEKTVDNNSTAPEHEKNAENIIENSSAVPEHENVQNKKLEENVEDKKSEDNLEENIKDKKSEDNLEENIKDKKSDDNLKERKLENNVENKKPEDNLEDKKNKIVESFPLRFEPNPSLKATDDNDLAKVTNQGSSALGGTGINPAAIIGLGDESPRHPYYQHKEMEAARGEKEDAGGKADTFDLTGDYNKQKEQEQIAEHKAKVAQEQDKDHKPPEKHHQKQKSESKKPERIDLGIKPLGNQQPPLPYKPEEPAGNTDRAYQPPGKTTVHPEGQNVGSKMTKKDKFHATINKAVGNFKQRVGKLVKNDNLVAKGTENKAEAERTKEFAEAQKKMKEET